MALYLQTNNAATVAEMYFNKSQAQIQSSFTKLSSGYRINSAADDAAGLGIAKSLNAQVQSYSVASQNAADAVSMVQTADGSADQISSLLTRMRELSVEAQNGTMSANDQTNLGTEYSQDLSGNRPHRGRRDVQHARSPERRREHGQLPSRHQRHHERPDLRLLRRSRLDGPLRRRHDGHLGEHPHDDRLRDADAQRLARRLRRRDEPPRQRLGRHRLDVAEPERRAQHRARRQRRVGNRQPRARAGSRSSGRVGSRPGEPGAAARAQAAPITYECELDEPRAVALKATARGTLWHPESLARRSS